MNTTTSVEPSCAITAGPMDAIPRMVSGISTATIPRLIQRFCRMMPLAFRLKDRKSVV